MPIAEQCVVYDTMCRAFDQGRPAGVKVVDRSADGVPVRIFTAGAPTHSVVYFHGGGFVVGGLNSHDDSCAEICTATGCRVIYVDYRLSPEHRHPAAFDDAWTATYWTLREFGDDLILAGDSAGGNLAAGVAHYARGRLSALLGQVLIYPGLGGDMGKGSYIEHANAPMLTRDDILYYYDMRFEGVEPQGDPTYAPLHDSTFSGPFSGLPPTVIFTADCDPLRDDGRDYAARLAAANVPVHWINEKGLVHGYLRARASTARGRAGFERITLAIEALGQRLWPYG